VPFRYRSGAGEIYSCVRVRAPCAEGVPHAELSERLYGEVAGDRDFKLRSRNQSEGLLIYRYILTGEIRLEAINSKLNRH
jgi:hypothetical protein